MPKHPDFQKIHDSMVRQYGTEKGDVVYYATMRKFNCDDTISMEENHHLKKCNINDETFKEMHRVLTLFPFHPVLVEKVVDDTKPLKIRGIAAVAGLSRNNMYYTLETLQEMAEKLVNCPIYAEHVSYFDSIGKVTNTWVANDKLYYEGLIYEEEAKLKIKNGLVNHVSVACDYEAIDKVDGFLPSGFSNAELSLVAVAGIPEANIKLMESLTRGTNPSDSVKLKEIERRLKMVEEYVQIILTTPPLQESKKREPTPEELKEIKNRAIRKMITGREEP